MQSEVDSAIGFADRIEKIYQRHPHHILPFIGSAYTTPSASDLRVMTIGINSYVSPKDWAPEQNRPHPAWLRGWFAEGKHRFFARVLKETAHLVQRLSG